MGAMASQINSLTIVYSNVYSDADQRKHQISVLLAIVRGIHRWPKGGMMTSSNENVDDVIKPPIGKHVRFRESLRW